MKLRKREHARHFDPDVVGGELHQDAANSVIRTVEIWNGTTIVSALIEDRSFDNKADRAELKRFAETLLALLEED